MMVFDESSTLQQSRFDNWLNRIYYYPGITPTILLHKKFLSFITAVNTSFIMGVALMAWINQWHHIFWGAVFLVSWMGPYAWITYRKRGDMSNLGFAGQILPIVSGFLEMVYLGGVIHSAGLWLLGLWGVMLSLLFPHKQRAFFIFGLFAVSMIAAGLLDPYLTIAPEMETPLNLFLFIMNSIYISAGMIMIMMIYLSQRIQAEQREKERIQAFDQLKTNFYTNISHEFRTPLTLILGMAEEIRTKPQMMLKTGTGMIRRNGKKLLRLVNQMLNLSRLDAGMLRLHAEPTDLIRHIRYLIDSFQGAAGSKDISLQFESNAPFFLMDLDQEMLEDVVGNLVSNAIKFTPENGLVQVSVSTPDNPSSDRPDSVRIQVSDTGIGIDKENLALIFDRFYQVDSNARHHSEGSGVGLALVREYVKLMDGKIEVESRPGAGTVFTVTLPVTGSRMQTATELLQSGREEELQEDMFDPGVDGPAGTDMPVLLIVEDNKDLVQYLKGLLQKDYRLLVAENGRIGCEKALKYIPDIILSDIMMPEMDGIELLEKMKTDPRTDHIPVVMLTAKADMDARLESLERGADAYLTKPFNREELFVRLRKLLDLRKKLQQRYAAFPPVAHDPKRGGKPEDRFMECVRQKLEDHLGEEDFGIDDLCRELAMSRAQFYRKFTALTNSTIGKYIRRYRLHKALELFRNSDLNVTEVGFEVGFSNPAYFSRIFKEEFGFNPSQARAYSG